MKKLRRVLYAYANYDRDLGYTQGMNFFVGLLLIYMDEDTAFRAFVCLMNGKRTLQRGYLVQGFPRLMLIDDMLTDLMKKKFPKILTNFAKQNVMIQMFTPTWFLTAFQSYSWKPVFQLQIFERFLFYGTRALLSFALMIFYRHQEDLEVKGLEVILGHLQRLETSQYMRDWRACLKDWDLHWIRKKEYQRLLQLVKAPQEELL